MCPFTAPSELESAQAQGVKSCLKVGSARRSWKPALYLSLRLRLMGSHLNRVPKETLTLLE